MSHVTSARDLKLMLDVHIGIDASNISQGGGLTHLVQLLRFVDPKTVGVRRVTVWATKKILDKLPEKPWLVKRSGGWAEKPLVLRAIFHQLLMPYQLKAEGCDLIFAPGGILPFFSNLPSVAMSQNMLPFDPKSALQFGFFSLMRFKFFLLRYIQLMSFRSSDGVIFLTQYAREALAPRINRKDIMTKIINHGIETRFRSVPRQQRPLSNYSHTQPLRILYVSIVMPYKHQIEVALAVAHLRSKNIPIEIQFIGAAWGNYGKKFKHTLKKLDPEGEFLKWLGERHFDSLETIYHQSQLFVFASSCETSSNILIEAMAAGLPIACSNRAPLPEIMNDAALYFDPECPNSISEVLEKLVRDDSKRYELSKKSFEKSASFSWDDCASLTFAFLADISRRKLGYANA
jgi:glycosyltransferase involved in cell wall biosynthesis